MSTASSDSARINVLLVDDDEDDWLLVRDALTDVAPDRYVLDWAATYEQGLAMLLRAQHEVGLLDYRLGARDGLMLVREAVRLGCTAPMILLTGARQREVDEAAVIAGAADYVDKTRLDGEVLDRAIRYALERRRAEERTVEVARAKVARDEAEARRAQLQELLATISHDLQQPLAAIRGRAQILQRRIRRGEPADDESIVDGLGQISDTAARMADQLRELVAVSRGGEADALELTTRLQDLREIVSAAVEDARQTAPHHTILTDLSNMPLVGAFDEGRLVRVFSNLLSNAAKYSPARSEIIVRAAAEPRAGAGGAVVSVRDQGIGIPADELGSIFEPFRRGSNAPADVSGTGIGLASARQFVHLHGGEVGVTSEPGRGSVFEVWLPLSSQAAREA